MNQYRRVWAEIDLDAIRHNILEMKRHIRNQTKLAAVVKADAYGHGAVWVAKALEDLADYFAVAVIEEGIELRNHGIKKPILIMGYTSPMEYAALLQYEIIPTIYCFEDACKLSEEASKQGKTVKLHIKIDTGMERIGFPAVKESVEAIVEIAKLPNLIIEGMFTHFAKADETNKDAMKQQMRLFLQMKQWMQEHKISIPIYHAANSATIMEEGDLHLDMVRSGITTYGLYPSDEVHRSTADLIPAMSLKSHVVHVKTVEAGVGIGYGWTYVTTQPTTVATVSVGYADGYKRALSNQAEVLIRGTRVPVIGRVCMDQIMVDVTSLAEVCVGDVVTLFGTDGEASIPVEEIADMACSFNYEFVCGLTRRVERVVRMHNEILDCKNYLFD